MLLKEEQKLEREMNGYMDWICRAGKKTASFLLSTFAIKSMIEGPREQQLY